MNKVAIKMALKTLRASIDLLESLLVFETVEVSKTAKEVTFQDIVAQNFSDATFGEDEEVDEGQ
jgi:hypothetical protein